MSAGGQTPEELETLFEDAFVTRDPDALAELFEAGAVLLAASDGSREARGSAAIGRLAATFLQDDRTYVAEPRRVIQARETALVVGTQGINVARRGPDGAWRYAIALLSLEPTPDQGASNDHAK